MSEQRHTPLRNRPLAIGPLRAFEAVARLLNFRAAAEVLNLTQPAISRQIKALEEEIGTALFLRGTRHVSLTAAGQQLHAVAVPLLLRLDGTVQQLRQDAGRQVINLSTFASFASLWLLPRLEAFQRDQPGIDIRVSASDTKQDLESMGFDLAVTILMEAPTDGEAMPLFGDTVTPVHSPSRAARIAAGELKPLRRPEDLAEHTLTDDDDDRPSSRHAQWRRWLTAQGLPQLQARRWLLLNFTYQQIQAAVAGQAVALARLPLVADALQRGELIETFGPARRVDTPARYWLRLHPQALRRPEVQRFATWLRQEAEKTRLWMSQTATIG